MNFCCLKPIEQNKSLLKSNLVAAGERNTIARREREYKKDTGGLKWQKWELELKNNALSQSPL